MQRDRNSVQEESLRAFLRKKRLEKGYSQLQLSLMLDNTRTFVSKYEAGGTLSYFYGGGVDLPFAGC